jgi:hypothetical protein
MNDSTPTQFTRESARRIAEVTRRDERYPRSIVLPRRAGAAPGDEWPRDQVDFWGWINGAGTHLHIEEGWVDLPGSNNGIYGSWWSVLSQDLELPSFIESGNSLCYLEIAISNSDGPFPNCSWGWWNEAGIPVSKGHLLRKTYFWVWRESAESRPYISRYGHFCPQIILPAPTQDGQMLVGRWFNAEGNLLVPGDPVGGMWWNPEAPAE